MGNQFISERAVRSVRFGRFVVAGSVRFVSFRFGSERRSFGRLVSVDGLFSGQFASVRLVRLVRFGFDSSFVRRFVPVRFDFGFVRFGPR